MVLYAIIGFYIVYKNIHTHVLHDAQPRHHNMFGGDQTMRKEGTVVAVEFNNVLPTEGKSTLYSDYTVQYLQATISYV